MHMSYAAVPALSACSAPAWNLQELRGHLNSCPYFAARQQLGQPGAGVVHACDVREILNSFTASADERVMQRHLPALLQVRNM